MITECIKRYINNNPEEYKAFIKQVDIHRAKLPFNSRGEFVNKDTGKFDYEFDCRLGLELPKTLFDAINGVLKFTNEKDIFQTDDKAFNDKEYKWFTENFTKFVVPDLSNKQIF